MGLTSLPPRRPPFIFARTCSHFNHMSAVLSPSVSIIHGGLDASGIMITSWTLTAPLTVHRCNPPLGAVQASTKFHNGVHDSLSSDYPSAASTLEAFVQLFPLKRPLRESSARVDALLTSFINTTFIHGER
ncbi:MAG: hypothetical protein ACTS4W_01380 [Candidatus Hodgkinia cicadicola]